MKKKVVFVDATEHPPKELRSSFGSPEIPLLLLVKGVPHVCLGCFREERVTNKETKKVTMVIADFIVFGKFSNRKVVAWRRCPRVPDEYHKVTGYAL